MKQIGKFLITVSILAAAFLPADAQRTLQMPEGVFTVPVRTVTYGGPFEAEGMSYNFAPTVLIYPDSRVDADSASSLVEEMELTELGVVLGSVYAVNPAGDEYDAEKDFETFKQLYALSSFGGNLKVIGIGKGATFVNRVIAPKAGFCIADIMSIGGEKYRLPEGNTPKGAPAYIAGKNAAEVASSYISMAGAVEVDEGKYVNPEESLLQVVVDPSTEKPLCRIVKEGWKAVLGRNYSYNNVGHTHYNGCQFASHGTNELEPYLDIESLGIRRNIVEFVPNQVREDKWLWYEYWPEEKMEAPAGSVPMLVLLHGNTNDPRTQAETSGFLQVAGQERFLVVEMEWQGNSRYNTMQHDGIENVIQHLVAKYPQIDASRIYAQGLSAGSITSTALGIEKSHIFAAVGGNSGGVFSNRMGSQYSTYDSLLAQAEQKKGNVIMPYCSVFGTADEVVRFYTPENWKGNSYLNAWNIYSTMAGLPAVEELDFSIDHLFGFKLENRESLTVKKGDGITVESGEIKKGNMPVIKIMAIIDYGHWNFQPVASMMWTFFKQFSRDPKTHQLNYSPGTNEKG